MAASSFVENAAIRAAAFLFSACFCRCLAYFFILGIDDLNKVPTYTQAVQTHSAFPSAPSVTPIADVSTRQPFRSWALSSPPICAVLQTFSHQYRYSQRPLLTLLSPPGSLPVVFHDVQCSDYCMARSGFGHQGVGQQKSRFLLPPVVEPSEDGQGHEKTA